MSSEAVHAVWCARAPAGVHAGVGGAVPVPRHAVVAARFHRKCEHEERRFYDSVASTLGVDRNTVLCIGDGYLGGKGRHGVMPTGLKVCLFPTINPPPKRNTCPAFSIDFCLFLDKKERYCAS